ncbi:sarcosine oxidase subunit gamma [Kineococcus rhizosphaerae]|uniref:Sarcosine oxidase subunit gamma n=1 Tax=Kineococcus rhizosphaerae TaxID=559628 RepID=A0A2T0R3H1_9ACTN|nr:sarcosine oxidase subunit gamma family protein [Kineococcus rhizosphaerae]PRY14609.1 sarcosine oxidase subunit gamma [Kineococcus rhizosphaerae]
MADALVSAHPLERWRAAFAELPTGVELGSAPLHAAADLRTGPEGFAAVAGFLGAQLPPAGRWVPALDGRVVWLGPDEWLVTSPSRTPWGLEAELAEVVAPHGGAAVDVSANRVEIRVGGAHARELLSGGCPVDLHPRAFGAGAAVATTLAHCGVVLLGLGEDGIAVLVRSSFARHLADWLLDAALEFVPVP